MEKKEFLESLSKLRKEVEKIRVEFKKLKSQYAEEISPFKIGDRVKVGNQEGIIREMIADDFGFLTGRWQKIKKDGTLYKDTSTLWSFDFDRMEKTDNTK